MNRTLSALSLAALISFLGPGCTLIDNPTTNANSSNSNGPDAPNDAPDDNSNDDDDIPVDAGDPNDNSGDDGAGDDGGSNDPSATTLASLQVFPPDNPWNQDVSDLPVHPNSEGYLSSMGLDTGLHPDFGKVWEGAPIGIPFVTVRGTQGRVPVSFYYGDESDPGPYPVPADAPIEGGAQSDGDRHVLVVDLDNRMLYELFDAWPRGDGGWDAGSGAVYDLTRNDLRPKGWTSADAAGLPIFPGLVRYDEVVERGEINHALRFTVRRTQRAYISPARHFASDSTDENHPPMGLRVRLRADFDESSFSPNVQVILRAMKRYGMLVADNGSDWYVSGAPDSRWNDDELRELGQVRGRDFEVLYTGEAED